MFTRAKRRYLLQLIAPLAAEARVERARSDELRSTARQELLAKGVTGKALRRQLRKILEGRA
jgi:hypothetical protein